MSMISFICQFSYELTSFINTNSSFAPGTVIDFIEKRVIGELTILMIFIILTTLVSVYVYSSAQREEKRQTLAVLTCIGASSAQKSGILLLEAVTLYSLPMILGVLCGILPARSAASSLIRGFATSGTLYFYPETAIGITSALFIIGMALICAFSLLALERRRASVISSVRRFNKREATERHTYRSSYTFRNMPITKRLAKKSVDYHAQAYGRIAAIFAATALYPVIAILFFHNIAAESVVVDTNPYDGVDTSAITIRAVDNIMLFFTIGFLILFSVGIIQLVNMIKIQNSLRRGSLRIYMASGMTEKQFREVLKYEYLSVLARVVIALIFSIIIIWFAFTGLG